MVLKCATVIYLQNPTNVYRGPNATLVYNVPVLDAAVPKSSAAISSRLYHEEFLFFYVDEGRVK